jgi:methylthioribose-1-phosphate isomerase
MPSDWTSLRWSGGPQGTLILLDQTMLPTAQREVECGDVESVWEAIRSLRVRGAPAIGVAAAYGVVVGMQSVADAPAGTQRERLQKVLGYLRSSRPTAVNLFWALDRMQRVANALLEQPDSSAVLPGLLREAESIHEADRAICQAIGQQGASLVTDGCGVLTHCNAGALATSDFGTALSVIYAAHEAGKRFQVFADETRPLLQGARLTAWELTQRGVDTTLICDSMAAQVMREGRIQIVIVGADRIALNGDTANKIGTYGLAVLAYAHHIPFYVAAPRSTFDSQAASGEDIPIEQRAAEEITHGMGKQTAPTGVQVYNPAFDVTPAQLIRGFICEQGIFAPQEVAKLLA